MDKLLSQFSPPFRAALAPYAREMAGAREIRIRVCRPLLLRGEKNLRIPLEPDEAQIRDLLLSFCGQALYARQEELNQGFLTLPCGHRVGVCGHMALDGARRNALTQVQALNLRIARQVPCDARALAAAMPGGALRSTLVLSEPGMGKTTLLRELARALSRAGAQVAIADERGELAACVRGVPQLDVGPCTDVMDNMGKAEAVRLLTRSMAPDVIVSDEIGGEADAAALLDARRCGVQVLCSAHAAGFAQAKRRPALEPLLRAGVFDRIVVLGGRVGRIAAVLDGEGRPC